MPAKDGHSVDRMAPGPAPSNLSYPTLDDLRSKTTAINQHREERDNRLFNWSTIDVKIHSYCRVLRYHEWYVCNTDNRQVRSHGARNGVYVAPTWSNDRLVSGSPSAIYEAGSKKMTRLAFYLNAYCERRMTVLAHFTSLPVMDPTTDLIIRDYCSTNRSISVCQCYHESRNLSYLQSLNAGTIIFGTEAQVTQIAALFALIDKAPAAEFTALIPMSVTEFCAIISTDHILKRLPAAVASIAVDTSLWTLIGRQSDLYEAAELGLSFGKREWYPAEAEQLGQGRVDLIETSDICARRELYEEFHVYYRDQFDYHGASHFEMRPNASSTPSVIYPITLAPDAEILYNATSQTIYF